MRVLSLPADGPAIASAADVVELMYGDGADWLAVVGDVSAQVAASKALSAFVTESNRGRHVWFVADEEALRRRLG